MMRQPRRWAIRSAMLSAIVALFSIAAADAGPLGSAMDRMAETTKVAKAALASKDPGKADAVMRAYAEEARSAAALFAGDGTKARDLHERFATFAATAESARQSTGNAAGFKAAFGAIVNQCRSCHAVYK